MKKFVLLLVLALLFVSASPAAAQDGGLSLRLTRDFGYAGFNSDIEGLFSVHADGPADLQRVDFYIDGNLLASVEAAPFRYQFTTKDHTPGQHTLSAVGFTAGGRQLTSNQITRVFLSADEARGNAFRLVIPILGVIAAVTLLATVVPVMFGRGKPTPGKYGISGGAVCPKCTLPFPLRFFSLHMGRSNLERCPHCGKWSLVRRASKEDLAAAEARWQGTGDDQAGIATKDRLQQQIDDSRYEN